MSRYDDLPVPWVAQWTGEVEVAVGDTVRMLGGRVSLPAMWGEPGDGEAEFGRLHAGRTVTCYRDGVCQVCGRRGADVYRVRASEGGRGAKASALDPPIHARCLPLSMAKCPHLADGMVEYVEALGEQLVWVQGKFLRWRAAVVGPVAQLGVVELQMAADAPEGFVLKQPFAEIRVLRGLVRQESP